MGKGEATKHIYLSVVRGKYGFKIDYYLTSLVKLEIILYSTRVKGIEHKQCLVLAG